MYTYCTIQDIDYKAIHFSLTQFNYLMHLYHKEKQASHFSAFHLLDEEAVSV